MTSRILIDEFLSHRNFALVRLSRATPVRGVKLDTQMPKGYSVAVAYLEETDPALKISGVKGKVDGAIIAVPSNKCEAAVGEAIQAGISRLWLQPGSESAAAIAFCESKGIPVVSDACILMYLEPVKSFHAFHRWLWKRFGRYVK
jgi:predicted CoA-binding protein